jgi:hypothetical protein
MSCKNCCNLRIKSFSFEELQKKWEDLFAPEAITPGYKLKYLNASERQRKPFTKTKPTFMYCAKGILPAL